MSDSAEVSAVEAPEALSHVETLRYIATTQVSLFRRELRNVPEMTTANLTAWRNWSTRLQTQAVRLSLPPRSAADMS